MALDRFGDYVSDEVTMSYNTALIKETVNCLESVFILQKIWWSY
jgi:hypothetical protein